MPRYIEDTILKSITIKGLKLYDWVNFVDTIPSADVRENVRGEWIDAWRSAMDGTRHWYRECSECGYERDDDNIDKDTNFCPNCGADMRGENE